MYLMNIISEKNKMDICISILNLDLTTFEIEKIVIDYDITFTKYKKFEGYIFSYDNQKYWCLDVEKLDLINNDTLELDYSMLFENYNNTVWLNLSSAYDSIIDNYPIYKDTALELYKKLSLTNKENFFSYCNEFNFMDIYNQIV